MPSALARSRLRRSSFRPSVASSRSASRRRSSGAVSFASDASRPGGPAARSDSKAAEGQDSVLRAFFDIQRFGGWRGVGFPRCQIRTPNVASLQRSKTCDGSAANRKSWSIGLRRFRKTPLAPPTNRPTKAASFHCSAPTGTPEARDSTQTQRR